MGVGLSISVVSTVSSAIHTVKASQLLNDDDVTFVVVVAIIVINVNKMLSYRRETALQGAL